MRTIAIMLVVLMGLTACSESAELPYAEGSLLSHTLFGTITIEDNVVHVDEVELVTTPYADQLLGVSLHDPERMAELGLTEDDLPNGYTVHNPYAVIATYELADETIYSFVDTALLYVEEEDGDRVYETTDRDAFLHHLQNTYGGMPKTVPFYIEVRDGQVVRIEEKLLLTQ